SPVRVPLPTPGQRGNWRVLLRTPLAVPDQAFAAQPLERCAGNNGHASRPPGAPRRFLGVGPVHIAGSVRAGCIASCRPARVPVQATFPLVALANPGFAPARFPPRHNCFQPPLNQICPQIPQAAETRSVPRRSTAQSSTQWWLAASVGVASPSALRARATENCP